MNAMSISDKDQERFWSRVSKTESCWDWTASKTPEGYGKISMESKDRSAHRIAYELAKGAIPAGLIIDHICHRRACVNPEHLRAVTYKQNQENLSSFRGASGVRGVSWKKKDKRWQASVRHHGKYYHVGQFTDLAEAEAAVIAKRNELFTHNDADRRVA